MPWARSILRAYKIWAHELITALLDAGKTQQNTIIK